MLNFVFFCLVLKKVMVIYILYNLKLHSHLLFMCDSGNGVSIFLLFMFKLVAFIHHRLKHRSNLTEYMISTQSDTIIFLYTRLLC